MSFYFIKNTKQQLASHSLSVNFDLGTLLGSTVVNHGCCVDYYITMTRPTAITLMAANIPTSLWGRPGIVCGPSLSRSGWLGLTVD